MPLDAALDGRGAVPAMALALAPAVCYSMRAAGFQSLWGSK